MLEKTYRREEQEHETAKKRAADGVFATPLAIGPGLGVGGNPIHWFV